MALYKMLRYKASGTCIWIFKKNIRFSEIEFCGNFKFDTSCGIGLIEDILHQVLSYYYQVLSYYYNAYNY